VGGSIGVNMLGQAMNMLITTHVANAAATRKVLRWSQS